MILRACLACCVACLALLTQPLCANDWADRESPKAVQQVSGQLVELLAIGSDFRTSGLFGRVGLRPVAEQINGGNTVAAMEAYAAYFYSKLRAPTRFGISVHDVSPYTRGICGGGQWPREVFDPLADRAAVLEQADLLMQGRVKLGQQELVLGEPGAVNWLHPYGNGVPVPADKVPDLGIVSGNVTLPLVQAYLMTLDRRYLERWQQYMDDWSLNSRYVASLHLCEVPSTVNAGGAGSALQLARVLGGLCAALPPDQMPLPPRVLAQVLVKLLRESPLPGIAYSRSNCHNWTPSAHLLLLAMIYDEFTVAPLYFQAGMRRNIQDNAVTQNLRDGSENQQCPWYNHNYLGVQNALQLFAARGAMAPYHEPTWMTPWRHDTLWRAEIMDHLQQRVNFFIHLRTPQGDWPLPFRGGDRRAADAASFEESPAAYIDPVNLAILRAVGGDPEADPGYDSEWFPYGGYNIVRTGWKSMDACGAMFASPNPGSYGGYRSRSNNNTFGLNAFNQDLIIDDCVGHYMYISSPLTVDGKQQFFHARDNLYKVGGLAAHKTYMVSAWTEPAPWRWHASDRFNLMEGVYAGPYGDPAKLEKTPERYGPEESAQPTLAADQTIRDVQHQRLVLYDRQAQVWIVTDRVQSPQPRRYQQVWMLPTHPGKGPGFEEQEITLDEARQVIATAADRKLSDGKGPDKANVELHQFSTVPLKYERRTVAKNDKNHYQMNGRAEFLANWSGQGATQVITAVHARQAMPGALREVTPLQAGAAQGFRAVTAAGASVQYLAAPQGTAELALGSVRAVAGALLLGQDGGVVLDCRSFQLPGQAVEVLHPDFEFRLQGDRLAAVTPIQRPIDPVVIGPDRNVFADAVEVTMTSRTPGVEIRYTLDGSEPTPQDALYQGPLTLSRSAVVKARGYRPGVTANPVQTSGTHATPTSLAVFDRRPLMEPVSASQPKPGLKARYWQADWQTLWHLTEQRAPQATGIASALFDLSVVPAENPPLGSAAAPRKEVFAVEYSGLIDIPADGVYTLHAPREWVYPDTDAGYELRVFLGNRMGQGAFRQRVVGIQEWYPSTRLHALGNWSVALKKGLHPIRVFYLDYRTDAPARLNHPALRPYIWNGVTPDLKISGPNLPPQPIPQAWLVNAGDVATSTSSRSSDMTLIPFTTAAATLLIALQAGDIGFQNQLPTDVGWTKQGNLPVTLVEDEGQQVVDLVDQSETDLAQLQFNIPQAAAEAMIKNGFEAQMRFKMLASGNDSLVLRLASFGSVMFSFERDTKNNRLVVAGFDPVAKKQVRAAVEGLDRYVTLKCVFTPAEGATSGKISLLLDDKDAFAFDVVKPERGGNKIELGGRNPKTQGHTRVASFRMAPLQPAAATP